MLDDWPLSLSRRSAAVRLDQVDVFYDFDWKAMFGHSRSCFPKGQSLTRLVTKDCPDGLVPTLLLTQLSDYEQHTRVSDDRFIAVVQIQEYLRQSGADPASTYFARQSRARMTDLSRLTRLSTQEVDVLLDDYLDDASLEAWLDRNPTRQESLSALLQRRPDFTEDITASIAPLADQIRALSEFDTDLVDAFTERMACDGWPASMRESVFATAAATAPGSAEMGQALGAQLPQRLQEYREDAADFRLLIERPEVNETEVQEFLERRPWLVGLEYHGVRGRLPILRGEIDFVLDRFDGYYDILELKAPSHTIIEETRQRRRGRPSSPSRHRLSQPLGQALAQAHLYRHILSNLSAESAEQLGLPLHRHPLVRIIVGRAADLSETGRRVLTELNRSLNRVMVIPFDQVADRIEGIISNLEALLLDPSSENI